MKTDLPESSPLVTLPLSRRAIGSLFITLAAIAAVMVVVTYFQPWFLEHPRWRMNVLGQELALSRENNGGAWFSSMLLLMVAGTMLFCHQLDGQADTDGRVKPRGWPALRHVWLLLAIMFGALSLDELGSLHERPTVLMEYWPSISSLDGWVGYLAVPIALVLLAMFSFGWIRVRESGWAFLALTAGLLFFASVPVHEQIEEAMLKQMGDAEFIRPSVYAAAEEGSEVLGSLFTMLAGLLYARRRALVSGLSDHRERAAFRIDRQLLMACTGALAVVLVASHLLYDAIPHQRLGVPRNWPPAALAAMAAALCFSLAARARRGGWGSGAGLPLILLGALSLALSADHGNAHYFTERLSGVIAGLAINVLLSVTALGAALLFWWRVPVRPARLGVALWAALVLVLVPLPMSVRPVVGFGASLSLLFGLRTLLSSRATEAAEARAGFTGEPVSVPASR